MKKVVPAFLLACTAFAMPMGVSMAQDAKLAPISDYVTSDVKPWLNDPPSSRLSRRRTLPTPISAQPMSTPSTRSGVPKSMAPTTR